MSNFSTTRKGYTPSEVDSYIKKLKIEHENQLAVQKERIFELKQSLVDTEKKLNDYKNRDALISKAILNAVQKAEEIEKVAREKYDMELSQLKAFHQKWKKYYERVLKRYPLDDELVAIRELNKKMDTVLSSHTQGKPLEFMPDDELMSEDSNARRMFEEEKSRISGTLGVNLDAISRVMENEEDEAKYEKVIQKMGGNLAVKDRKEDFHPMESIKQYLDKAREMTDESAPAPVPVAAAPKTRKSVLDAPLSEGGFDYEEAMNPSESLEDIMKDLGLLDD